jgi:GNAT superfamily N-acetyltransferase
MTRKLTDLSEHLESMGVRNLIDQLEYPIDVRDERTTQILSDYQNDPSLRLFGLKEEGMLLGLIGLLLTSPYAATIRHIVVRRELRGCGVGRRLIEAVCLEFSLVGLEAETDDDAVDFYRKCGFSIQSLGEIYPGVGRYRCRQLMTQS